MILLSLFCVFLIKKKFGFYSVELIALLVFFLYGFSFEIDHYLFGMRELVIPGLTSLKYDSSIHDIIKLLYLSFIVGYTAVIMGSNGVLRSTVKRYNRNFHNILLIFWSVSLFYLATNLYGLHRLEKISYIAGVKYFHYFAMIGCFYSVGLLWVYTTTGVLDYLEKLLLAMVLFYGLMDGGREIFMYIFLGLLPYLKKNKRALLMLVLTVVIGVMLSLWKPVTAAISAGVKWGELYNLVILQGEFSFSGLDPKPSLLLLSEYINGSELFSGMKGSYVFNMFGQIGSAFGLIDYSSLARTIMSRVDQTAAAEGAGLAFSGILESMLNFWIFGPFLLGIILATAIRLSRSNMNVNMLYVYMSLIALKLVRTEIMVVLKLYILPILVCVALFTLKKTNKYEIR
jgi:hypothetical protein